MLNEISQTQRDKYCIFSFMGGSRFFSKRKRTWKYKGDYLERESGPVGGGREKDGVIGAEYE
jgi:hypothetical protein